MKIYAFYLKFVQEGKLISGIFFKVGTCMATARRELIKATEGNLIRDVKNIRIEAEGEMSLPDLAKHMKPELEKMIKDAADKSDLLDVISKLPID